MSSMYIFLVFSAVLAFLWDDFFGPGSGPRWPPNCCAL